MHHVSHTLHPTPSRPARPALNHRSPTTDLLPLQLVLLDRERDIQQLLLLPLMHGLQSRRDTSTRIAPRIHDMSAVMMFRVIQQRLDPRLREAPGPRIQRLLLAPDDGLCVRVAVQVFLQLPPGERVQLLDAGQGDLHALLAFGLAVGVQGRVDLACAEDHAVDFFRGVDGAALVRGIPDQPLEVRVAGELLDVGARERVAEEVFAEEEDESWGTVVSGVCS